MRSTFLWVLGALLCLAWLTPLRLGQYVHDVREVAEARVEIPPGAGLATVARELERAELGPWPAGTVWGLRWWGRPSALKAGTYAFTGPYRLADVFEDLETGRVEQVSVTLPEGLTARQMGPLLEAAGVTPAAGFVALAYDPAAPARWGLPGPSLEGFLYPDTYRFGRGQPPERVAAVLIARFREVSGELAAAAPSPRLDLLSWVTLASMVEKETAAASEKPTIAAVFLNRLGKGMRLESDPTVIYGLEKFDGDLRREDLRRDTPYNTYTRRGLPPGPIANPGRESLAAVLRPAPTPYLYFVSRNDGTHVFSETYPEHRQAVRRYQGGGGR